MDSEDKIIIAFVFKRNGKGRLSFSEMYLTMSMNLSWCNPKQAKKFVEQVIDKKLLTKEEDILKPNFEIDRIEIPVGFRPSEGFFEGVLKEKPRDQQEVEKDLVEKISEKSGEEIEAINKKVNVLANNKKIVFEVALLLYAKEKNVDLKDYYPIVEEEIFKENKE